MADRRIAVYYAWSRPAETGAPLAVIENRFPALFESRRMLYPRFEELSDPSRFDQSVAGFLDHIMKKNFTAFVEQARVQTGRPVLELERVHDDGRQVLLDEDLVNGVDTLILISFDSLRTGQAAAEAELLAARTFLAKPGNLLVVSPHHDIGHADGCGASTGCISRKRIFSIMATGPSRRSRASVASDARSSQGSGCRWKIDLGCDLLPSPTGRRHRSKSRKGSIGQSFWTA